MLIKQSPIITQLMERTNRQKYIVIQNQTGSVDVRWSYDDDTLKAGDGITLSVGANETFNAFMGPLYITADGGDGKISFEVRPLTDPKEILLAQIRTSLDKLVNKYS